VCVSLSLPLALGQEAPLAGPEAPVPEVDLQRLFATLESARKDLSFDAAALELERILGCTPDPEQKRRIAAQAADFLAEAILWQRFLDHARSAGQEGRPIAFPGSEGWRVRPLDGEEFEVLVASDPDLKSHLRYRDLPAAALLTMIGSVPLETGERLELARFAFFRDAPDFGIRVLHEVLMSDPATKDRVDAILAKERGEPVPFGGYAWYVDRFLPSIEVHRRLLLEEVIARADVALADRSPVAGQIVARIPAGELDRVEPRLVATTSLLAEALAQAYEPLRDLVLSYRKNKDLGKRRLDAMREWETVAASARELIGRYDKPEQSKVDEIRKELLSRSRSYQSICIADELPLRRFSRADAEQTLSRIETFEAALDVVARYREEYHGGIGAPFPERSLQGARVHVLPGRRWAGLEDSLYTLLLFHAGRNLKFLARIEELMHASGDLLEWERVVLRDFWFDALDRLNDRLITTSDPEELGCVLATNAYRRTLLLPPYEIDERLVQAARDHSIEMQELKYFGHESPTEKLRTPTDRIRVAGYNGGAGENCLAGQTSGEGAFEGWYHSPGHHRGLISGSPHVGVGADFGHDLWTMNFAGSDFSWRIDHHRDTTEEEERLLAGALELFQRERKGNEATLQLLIIGKPALAPLVRSLAAQIRDGDAETRRLATRTAHVVALLSAAHDLDVLADFAVKSLLRLLEDGSQLVRAEANHALMKLAEKNLGFSAAGPPLDRAHAVNRWRKWWKGSRAGFAPRAAVAEEEIVPFEEVTRRATEIGAARPSPDAPIRVFTPAERLALARRLGGGQATEQAIESSLEWLVQHQSQDGGWYGRSFVDLCKHDPCTQVAEAEYEIAMTGLALLCLINGGSTLEIGPYKESVRRGVEFLQKRLQDMGKFAVGSGFYMYQHALGAQALVEAYGTSGDPVVKEAAQRSLDFLVFAQHPEEGGWRYVAREYPDTSVSGWQVLCIASALKAGLRVSGLKAAREWFDKVTEPSYYRVGYQSPTDAPSREGRMTAVGMVARQALGSPYNDPMLRLGAYFCMERLPRPEGFDLYFSYYATLALFQIGGEEWKQWNKAMTAALLARIHRDKALCSEGSYDVVGPFTERGGRIYSTALCTLMLEVYYRYDRFPEVRNLSVTGSIQDQIAPLLRLLGNSGDEVARGVAMRRVEDEFGTAAQGPLLRLLRESQDPQARHDASFLLRRCATSAVLTDLLELMMDSDDVVLANVSQTLARVAHPACVPELVKRLEDPRVAVRGHAARTLGKVGDVSALEGLVARSTVEPDGWVKNEILEAIRALGNRSGLMALLADAGITLDPRRLEDVREGLSMLERENLVEPLLKLKTAAPDAYAGMVGAIAADGRQSLIPLLIAALSSNDGVVCERANRLLLALTGAAISYDPAAPSPVRKETLRQWTLWWKSARDSLLPDPDSKNPPPDPTDRH